MELLGEMERIGVQGSNRVHVGNYLVIGNVPSKHGALCSLVSVSAIFSSLREVDDSEG